MYTPKPIKIDDVALSEDLLELTEKLAENTHDIWADGRIKDGWTYGEERNDALKHHPCPVPYSELGESEKEYDRNTALETLKLRYSVKNKIKRDPYRGGSLLFSIVS